MSSPVRCVRCDSTAVILTKATDYRSDESRWQYRCLDDQSAWWVDEHGGRADEYQEVPK